MRTLVECAVVEEKFSKAKAVVLNGLVERATDTVWVGSVISSTTKIYRVLEIVATVDATEEDEMQSIDVEVLFYSLSGEVESSKERGGVFLAVFADKDETFVVQERDEFWRQLVVLVEVAQLKHQGKFPTSELRIYL